MLKYILSLFNPPEPFQKQKPKKYVTKDEYASLNPRQKKLLHSKYEVYQKELHS